MVFDLTFWRNFAHSKVEVLLDAAVQTAQHEQIVFHLEIASPVGGNHDPTTFKISKIMGIMLLREKN